MADGTIPEIQAERLRTLRRWLETNGEAIYGTRPWERSAGKTTRGVGSRLTSRYWEGSANSSVAKTKADLSFARSS